MKRWACAALAALLTAALPASVAAQQVTARVVTTCSSAQGIAAGQAGFFTIDLNGNLCTSGGGGGGSGGSVTAAGVNGTVAQAVQGITGGVPIPVTGTFSAVGGSISNATSGQATTTTNTGSVSYGYGFNGSTWDQLQVDASKNLKVNLATALPAGAAVIGAVSQNGTWAVSWSGQSVGVTSLPAIPAGTNSIGTVILGAGAAGIGTVNLGSIGSASTAANQTAVQGSATGGTAATASMLGGGVFSSAPPTLTNGQQEALQLDANGNLRIAGTFSVFGATSNASSGVATSSTNSPSIAYGYGFNGTTWDQLQVDAFKSLKVNLAAALPPGGNTIGIVNLGTIGAAATATNQINVQGSATGGAPAVSSMLGGAIFNSAPLTLTNGQQASLQLDTNGNLKIAGSFSSSGTTSNASDAVATSSTNSPSVAYNYGFNGATWDRLQVDASKSLKAVLTTGAAVIGAVTQSGTWNVTINAALPAGSNAIGSVNLGTIGTAATASNQTAVQGSATGGTAGTASQLMGAIFNSAPPTLTNGQQGSLQLDTNGNLKTAGTASLAGTTSNGTDAQATTTINLPTASYNYGFNGTTWDRLQVDASKFLKVVLQTGSNTIGTVNLGTIGSAATAANQTAMQGTVAPGTAATVSMLAGGVFNTSAPTLTNGQQAALQFDANGNLKIAGSFSAAGTTSNASDGVATSSTNTPNVSYGYGFNGTSWDRVQVDGSKNLKVVLATGANTVGTVNLGTIGTAATAANQATAAAIASTTSGQTGHLALGAVTTAAPTYTTAQSNPLSLTTAGALRVDGTGTTVGLAAGANTIGAVTQASGPWSSNITQFGGVALSTGTGAGGTGIPRVTVSNDSTVGLVAGTALVGKVGIDQTTPGTTNKVSIGTDGTVAVNAALPAGTNSIGTVQIGNTPNSTPILVTQVPGTSGGDSVFTGSIGATVTAVKASAGSLEGYYVYNNNATVAYLQCFDLATGSVTLGTTAPKLSLGIPATSGANISFHDGIPFATAISCAVTTTRAGLTGPASTVDLNLLFK